MSHCHCADFSPKDASAVEEAAKKSRTPRDVIRTRTLTLLHDFVEVCASCDSPKGYVVHGNGIAMSEASEAGKAFSPTLLI